MNDIIWLFRDGDKPCRTVDFQGLELPTNSYKKIKYKKNVYASILGHLDMSYMQHIMNIPYLFASNKS